ncbi:MAG: Crp/Fnr family transcriptional regulator [Lentisphaeraceae bacterium]|nr:Crp/Fnr family transcriptional regulator [Lentisphaeraceae bacterium]
MSLLTSLRVLDHPVSKFKIGDMITEESCQGGKVFILIKGIVEVSINRKTIATVIDPGAIFGEIASVCGCNHSATVTVVEDSEFYIIDNFISHLKKYPDDSMAVIRSLCERIVMLNDNEVARNLTY